MFADGVPKLQRLTINAVNPSDTVLPVSHRRFLWGTVVNSAVRCVAVAEEGSDTYCCQWTGSFVRWLVD